MSEYRVATRYAKALLDLAREEQSIDAVYKDMQQVVETIADHAELRAVLENPIIKQDKKEAIVQAVFSKTLQHQVLQFFNIMIRKGRSGLLYGLGKEFINLYYIEKNIKKASVTSAIPLEAEHVQALTRLLEEETGNAILLEQLVDPALIGGLIVRVGDRQIDASVSGKLDRLEKHLKAGVI